MFLSGSHKYEVTFLITILFISAGVRLPGLFGRSIWRDEAVTLLETAGYASPVWPKEPTPARVPQHQFVGAPTFIQIAQDLRQTDVHPPLYYWSLSLWRQGCGFSLEAARAFSLLCSLGTILALYLLLRFGGVASPLVPTTVYAISTGAVYYGQEARAYALASFLLTTGAVFAYLACEVALQNRRSVVAYSIAMAVCCGAALHTNYLTLFPLGVILGWFVVSLRSVSRAIALVAPLITAGLGSIGFSTLLPQLGARPDQFIGFVGIVAEIKELLRLNLHVLWAPNAFSQGLTWGVYRGLVILTGITLVQLLRHWQETNRKLWALLLGLACAPSLGVLLMDLLFNKHLHELRYVVFAGPALAVMTTYGLARLISCRRRLGMSLFAIIVGFQMTNINWGFEKGSRGQIDLDTRTLASLIKTSSSPSHLVVIGGGFGRGFPASVIYELEPETMIVVLRADSDLEALWANIQAYDDVWLVFSADQGTANAENTFLTRLQQSGRYREVFRSWPAIHLRIGNLPASG